MSEQDRKQQADEAQPDERVQDRPEPDQHDATTEEDTASGGAPQEPDHSR